MNNHFTPSEFGLCGLMFFYNPFMPSAFFINPEGML
jgi:hypothetical protein